MKFNWGTGILIFLIVFLLACAGFIYFAFQQEVNLVHKDYYEKGVDYNQQMEVNSRSAKYKSEINVESDNDFLLVTFNAGLVSQIDSGSVLLYRPSSSKHDLHLPLKFTENTIRLSKSDLQAGRYILKLYWYDEGLKYEVDRPISIQ